MSDAASSHSTGWRPATYYPDPAIHALDPRFEKYWLKLSAVERLATGLRWAEGPVWFGDGRYLLWSDIPNNRIMRWDEETGAVSVFRKPSNYANGNTRDRQGRLVTCEHRGRRVTRTEYDGAITVLVDSFEGKRLNSPNDVVVKSDGSIWFTDPPFGMLGYYEGDKAEPELPMNVYRVDGTTGAATVVADDVHGPNGLCFSPDENEALRRRIARACRRADLRLRRRRRRHAARQRARLHRRRPGHARRHALRRRRQSVVRLGHGRPELDGVVVFNPDGELIGHIALPERCANLCFGGTLAQPPVHGGEPVALRAVCEHAGRAGWLARCHHSANDRK